MEILDDAGQTSTQSTTTYDIESGDTHSDDSTLSTDLVQRRRSPVAALWAVQQTSSAIYQVATPYLYRYLRITHHGLILLLRNFRNITRIHEVINQDPEINSHPLDFQLYHRLQWALSFVLELHLTVYSNHSMAWDCLTMYTEICTALKVLGRPPLWSALDKVGVTVREMGENETADQHSYACLYDSAFMRAIGPTLHPTFLAIELPDPPLNTHFKVEPVLEGLRSSLCSMRADHVTVSNLSDFSQGIPSARLSLTIGFSARCGKLQRGSSSSSSEALTQRCLIIQCDLPPVLSLTLIGIDRGLEGLPSSHIRSALGDSLSMFQNSFETGDVRRRYRIRPWNSPDHGDWDVWYSYNEPFGDQ